MRLAAGVEYCGTGFYGWQRQPGQRTCAGRTDAGVHAVQQVIHFDTSSERALHSWVLGMNSHLPADISISWVRSVADDFHARFSATARRYRYLVLNRPFRVALNRRFVAWEHRQLDEARMARAARDLVGEHDFTSYRAASCQARSSVREVQELVIRRNGELVVIEIQANAFLHHMVRNIAGVLIAIGAGRQAAGWAREILEARDRTAGGVTAPAQGLYLTGVSYPESYRIPRHDRSSVILP